jgi:hypothetical protein
MALEDLGIGIALRQKTSTESKLADTVVALRWRRTLRVVFYIEDPHLVIASRGYDGPVVRMWHELNREDILRMTSGDGSDALKLMYGLRCVTVDIDHGVVGSGGKQLS